MGDSLPLTNVPNNFSSSEFTKLAIRVCSSLSVFLLSSNDYLILIQIPSLDIFIILFDSLDSLSSGELAHFQFL